MLIGADPDQLESIAGQFDAAAKRLQLVYRTGRQAAATVGWSGPDAQQFRQQWDGVARARLQQAEEVLAAAARTLRDNAAAQRRTSEAGTGVWSSGGAGGPGGSGGSGGSGGGGPIGGGGPATPEQAAAERAFVAASPSERAEQWSRLDPDSRARLIAEHPDLVGNTDGIPVEDRYLANHVAIVRDLDAERAANPTSARTRALEFLLENDKQVVVYQPDRGRVATVEGNLATAHHVGVFVPGTGSSFDDFAGSTWNKADAIQHAADRYAPDDTAVVAWLGYDAPPTLVDAAFPGRATEGGALLSSFTGHLGLRGDQELTLVGHSYGSTVVGHGVLDGAPAHDVVVLGSPGIGVEHERDLHLPAGGHVYAERAPQDQVSNLEAFGNDPSMPSFGGVRLTTNDPGHAGVPTVSGHSAYFSPESASVDNVGRVLTHHSPVTQRPSVGDWAADLTDVPSPGEAALHAAAGRYHGPGSSVIGAIDRVDRVAHGEVEQLERNVVDGGAAVIDKGLDVGKAAVGKGGELLDDVGDFLGL